MTPRSEPGALEALPARQARWLVAQVGVAVVLALTAVWQSAPELALSAAIGAGAAAASPQRGWSVPLIAAGTLAAGAACHALGWPAVLGSGAVAGALATWSLPHRTDALDVVHGALGSLIGSSLGLWAAGTVPLGGAPVWAQAALIAGLTGLVGSQGLIAPALRFDRFPTLPTRRQIVAELAATYRAPVLRALDLYHGARGPMDPPTRRGLAEVVRWVHELERALQTLDRELATIDPERIAARIAEAEGNPSEDAFTRERHQATATHLRRLLDHRGALAIEHGRTAALAEYALAFLEEARAGLAIAQPLPGEAVPDRLPEVLGRLRTQARSGEARRASAREVGL